MEEEFKRIYDCMRASETVADGEYFVIHADHLHDFKRAIEHYFDESKPIETYLPYTISDDNLVGLLKSLNVLHEDIADKLNEIINKINRMER